MVEPTLLPVVRIERETELDVTSAEAKMSILERERAGLIRLPEAVKKVSLTLFVFCLFALATYGLTGFAIVHPFFGILLTAGGAIFFLIGILMAKEDRLRDG
jgi:hypothetical protein